MSPGHRLQWKVLNKKKKKDFFQIYQPFYIRCASLNMNYSLSYDYTSGMPVSHFGPDWHILDSLSWMPIHLHFCCSSNVNTTIWLMIWFKESNNRTWAFFVGETTQWSIVSKDGVWKSAEIVCTGVRPWLHWLIVPHMKQEITSVWFLIKDLVLVFYLKIRATLTLHNVF